MKKKVFREIYKDLKIINPKEITEDMVYVKPVKEEKPKKTTKKKVGK